MARFIRRLFATADDPTQDTDAAEPDADDLAAIVAGTVVAALRGKYGQKKWTRVHSLQRRWERRDQVFKLTDEVAAAKADFSAMEETARELWAPLFDPVAFKQDYPRPQLADWRILPNMLLYWATVSSTLRRRFAREAARHGLPPPALREPHDTGRRKRPYPYSTAAASRDGQPEWQRHQLVV